MAPSSALAMGGSLDETAEEELWDLLTCHRSDSCLFKLESRCMLYALLLYMYSVRVCQIPPLPI